MISPRRVLRRPALPAIPALIHRGIMILVSSIVVRRRSISIISILTVSCVSVLLASQQPAQTPGGAAAAPSAQQYLPQPNVLSVVVLDPGHGGADPGAHSSTGINESDVVLGFARLVRISLESQGFRVILTRQGNENPSFDDRSAKANAQRGSIFITLHVASTGQSGTARVYSFPKELAPGATPESVASSRPRLVPWDHAQQAYVDSSAKLAGLMQTEMAKRFPGSPESPAVAAVRQLRTVMAPAIAIEVSSVSLPDRAPLDQMGPLLADAVASAVVAFRPIYETEVK